MTEASKVETMRWRHNQLEMIDQRVLPMRFEYLSYTDADAVAEGIRRMVVRGAPAIGCAAAYGVALHALSHQNATTPDFDKALDHAFEVLAASRPTAVNLFWALQRMREAWAACQTLSPPQVAQQLLQAAHDLLAQDLSINRAMGEHGAALLPDGARVLTHCNAGALATAGHGTALGVFRSAVAAGKNIPVYADETRLFLQGARLTAWEMVHENIPVTLITDNMAGHFLKSGRIGCVVVGADRIAANGDVANKIGTYSVAVLAKENGVPFYVAAPVSTFDLTIPDGDAIPIEQRNRDEVTHVFGVPVAPENIGVANPAFDVTPSKYVSAIICEHGVAKAPYKESLAALAKKKLPA